jgi:hypothetical protein
MLKLMATIASLMLLLVGTVVALEAVGLIFGAAPPQPRMAIIQIRQDDPEALAGDLLWQRQEEAEARRRADQDRHQFEAERRVAAAQAAEEQKGHTDALAWAERYRQRVAHRRVAASDRPQPAAAEPAEAAGKPQSQRPLQEARALKLAAAATEAGHVPRIAKRALARPNREESTGGRDARATRARCPFLSWLQAFMAPLVPRRGAT